MPTVPADTPESSGDVLTLISWKHPGQRVTEIVCRDHEAVLLGALKLLGIGSRGQRVTSGECIRCAADRAGVEARFLLGLAGPR